MKPENNKNKTTCPFYSAEKHQCVEVEDMKKTLKWGIGIIITVFLACFGYFAHNQDRRNDIIMKMSSEVVGLKNMIEYRVLPHLDEDVERF